jgi:hypothetical protein
MDPLPEVGGCDRQHPLRYIGNLDTTPGENALCDAGDRVALRLRREALDRVKSFYETAFCPSTCPPSKGQAAPASSARHRARPIRPEPAIEMANGASSPITLRFRARRDDHADTRRSDPRGVATGGGWVFDRDVLDLRRPGDERHLISTSAPARSGFEAVAGRPRAPGDQTLDRMNAAQTD